MPSIPDAFFVRSGPDRFEPTVHTGGAWSDDEMHFSPVGGLITHALESHPRSEGLVVARISFDILGKLSTGPCVLRVETIRPGRTIELLEATLLLDGRPAVRARAWCLLASDTAAIAGGEAAPLPDPDTLERRTFPEVWGGGYVASLDYRPIQPRLPGRAAAWLASTVDLVAGETVSGLASFVALVDTANGIAVREDPRACLFPNVDLTLHLHRQPEGRWVGLDTTVVFGPGGQGVTSTRLHDRTGPVGRVEQILTVRPLAD